MAQNETALGALFQQWRDSDDPRALELIVEHTQDRLRQMASSMLRKKPHVKRWYETDDVLQNSLVRLHRALSAVRPDSYAGFIGLAATQIRRELIDLARSLYGPLGHARNHHTEPVSDSSGVGYEYEEADGGAAAEIHELVDSLPDDQRKVFELMHYQELTQPEVAELLNVSARTVKRRWRAARLRLQQLITE